jgi:TRAP-type C4-dicarboxylate transport system permease large subunit
VSKVIPPLIPLLLTMVFILLLVTFIPELSMWLPRLFSL